MIRVVIHDRQEQQRKLCPLFNVKIQNLCKYIMRNRDQILLLILSEFGRIN